MFGISGTELLIIGVFAFFIFGPDKIPEILRTVNGAIKTFKKTQEDVERLIRAEMYDIDPTMEDTLRTATGSLSKSVLGESVPRRSPGPTESFGADEADEEDEE